MSSLLYLGFLLLGCVSMFPQAARHSRTVDTEFVSNGCNSICTCSYLGNHFASYCCPDGVPDAERCSGHTHTHAHTTVVPKPQKCQECSDRRSYTMMDNYRWCSTSIGRAFGGCRYVNRVPRSGCITGCTTAGECTDTDCTATGECTGTACRSTGCTTTGECTSDYSCCGHSAHEPIQTQNLQEAILYTANRTYSSRKSFLSRIMQIVHNEHAYSWPGESYRPGTRTIARHSGRPTVLAGSVTSVPDIYKITSNSDEKAYEYVEYVDTSEEE